MTIDARTLLSQQPGVVMDEPATATAAGSEADSAINGASSEASASSQEAVTAAASTTSAASSTEGAAESAAASAETVVETPAAPSAEESQALEFLRKQLGRDDIKSLDDLKRLTTSPATAAAAAATAAPTAEEEQQIRQRFQNDATKYGLDQQLFDTTTLAAFNVDKAKTPQQLALEQYRNQVLQADPALAERFKTDGEGVNQEIQELFEDNFFLNEEEGSVKRKLGLQSINNIATNYLNNTYENILGVEDAFKSELETQQRAVEYKSAVEQVISSQPEQLQVQIGDKTYTYTIPEPTRKDAKEQLLSAAVFNSLGSAAIDKSVLASAYTQHVFGKERDKFIGEVAKAYHADQVEHAKLGRLHIPVSTTEGGTSQITTTLQSAPSPAKTLLDQQLARS